MPISFVTDMDGVIYHGNRLIPCALDFVERLRGGGHKFLFLTNNSQSTPRDFKHKLDHM
jgi:NagD protein